MIGARIPSLELVEPSAGAGDPPIDSLLQSVRRTVETIKAETAALDSGARADHGEFRRRKDMCLLDLSRRAPALVRAPRDPDLMAALGELKTAIIHNQTALRLHVNAAHEVTTIIMRAIADEESDRTYSAYPPRRGPRS